MKINDNYLAYQFENNCPLTKDPIGFVDVWKKFSVERKIIENSFSEETISNLGFSNIVSARKNALEKILTRYPGHKSYLLSSKVIEQSTLLKEKKINLNWFDNVKKPQSGTYILDKDNFVRFSIDKDDIYGVWFDRIKSINGEDWNFDYHLFHITLGKDKKIGVSELDSEIIQKYSLDFTKLFMFIEMADIQQRVLFPGKKMNSTGFERDKVVNDTGMEVVVVNTNWNYSTIRNDDFKVSTHFRIQPCGISRSSYKIVLINEYNKHGYKRRSGREIRDSK